MQEDLHQVNLPESMKTALHVQHLSRPASQWYLSEFHTLRDRSLASVGRALKREFGSKLSKAQIGQMVASEKKKATEKYREYSLRLRDMATTATWDGVETTDSNNLALSSFITNAWRKHTDNLRLVIREDSNYPIHEFDRAITKLCSIAGHQGALTFQQRPIHQSKPAPENAQLLLGKRKSSDEAGRSGGSFKRRDYSRSRCGTCGELGHTTGYHDRFIALKSSGMANVARSSEDSDLPAQVNNGVNEQKELEPNSFD
ncbi:hypothetical protein PC129_g17197 [Phytophthora cactorum]|uniref:Uncharacterized protein n=1 Tax=Phytophthora cactorum TaxID=29920 RepID=A0A329RKV1_9STRA|nr:hypothetical protein Pcac1_g2792 [Phytophthora cactorum]KAG2806474.1 hypothetical protein PC112_g17829 [Phytophthora cactorum]KAG2806645.1 hypothetical protein PC111_g17275 [Phytophthora cactorum]KAG2844608.1 hypothetical protein PC113_g18360 [Phytophthora cactorum]KAG2885092.1 hypothetical protein PC114_g19848 [Phytophthora cactorum]